jgi:hypothetical protein
VWLGFRLFAPNEVFPVTHRRGRAAHLDVGGARGEAIRRALEDQLGLTVCEIRPVGLSGSAGSTPLRLSVEGAATPYLFGKLYSRTHLRSDRWYKLGRELLYGRLEDEKPFNTVLRLVQQEDYALRVMAEAGVRGNRRLNHAIHMATVTQIRHRHSPGRAYYDRKIAEGHTGKAAIRALKRRISDAIYTRLRHDAAQRAT